MNIIRQHGNAVAGDVIAGNKITNLYGQISSSIINELASLNSDFLKGKESNYVIGDICEELQHYFTSKKGSDVRGLESKLADSGRGDLIEDALELKETAAKVIMKYQSSPSAQRMFTLILTEIHTQYDLTVAPLIQAEAPRPDVDRAILQVVQGIFSGLGANALKLNVRQMLAFLYFLGGNCHIRWDKKC